MERSHGSITDSGDGGLKLSQKSREDFLHLGVSRSFSGYLVIGVKNRSVVAATELLTDSRQRRVSQIAA